MLARKWSSFNVGVLHERVGDAGTVGSILWMLKLNPYAVELPFVEASREVPRGEKMLYSGTDQGSYITEYTLVYKGGKHPTPSIPTPKPGPYGRGGAAQQVLAPPPRDRPGR